MSASSRTTGWVGWIWFGAIMMLTVGILNVLSGLVAIFAPSSAAYIRATDSLLIFDPSGWGWVHLIIGALVCLVSFALFSGRTWARAVAVVLLLLNFIAQMMYLPATPWWSVIAMVLDVLVIWAIIVHGDEAEPAAHTA